MKNKLNIEIIKANDGDRFKGVIPHPSRSMKSYWEILCITSLFYIIRFIMFLTFYICYMGFIRLL
jgi:hypothetical protein